MPRCPGGKRPTYSFTQSAQLLGVSRYAVSQMVRRGVLQTSQLTSVRPRVTVASLKKCLTQLDLPFDELRPR
jgi:predicted transcriptional regulator